IGFDTPAEGVLNCRDCNRDETRKGDIRAYDANTGQMLSRHVITNFAQGKYRTWSSKDHLLTKLPSPDAVLSGVFVSGGT
ncbi:MAG: hypothetical protein ACREJC_05245, partial [Tepidisphaeraceae bacterium]